MLIDWFTVIAQIVNFLMLVWLLKIFLYKPILKMIADRQNEISAELNEAKLKKMEAEAEHETFRKKNNELDQQKAEKIKKVNEEMEQLREHLTSEAKLETEKRKEKWYDSLKNEKETVFRDLSDRIQKEIFSTVRKTIADLSEGSLEEHIIDIFLQRIKKLAKEEKEKFVASDHLQIKTASELPEILREKIIKAIQTEFEKAVEVTFIVSSDLISGIVLISNGQKLSWSIADYLSSLELRINEGVSENLGRSNG